MLHLIMLHDCSIVDAGLLPHAGQIKPKVSTSCCIPPFRISSMGCSIEFELHAAPLSLNRQLRTAPLNLIVNPVPRGQTLCCTVKSLRPEPYSAALNLNFQLHPALQTPDPQAYIAPSSHLAQASFTSRLGQSRFSLSWVCTLAVTSV